MMSGRLLILFHTLVLGLALSGRVPAQAPSPKQHHGVQKQTFGTHVGRPINLYTLTNSHGLEIRAMNYGGIIVCMRVPDRKGQYADILLGHDTFDGYIPNPPYIGAI